MSNELNRLLAGGFSQQSIQNTMLSIIKGRNYYERNF